jgi:hypothetical protein
VDDILGRLEKKRAAAPAASRPSTAVASSPRASGSSCCSTPIPSRSGTCSPSIGATISLVAASRGFIDDVILPRDTRRRLCRALAMLHGKSLANPWKKHDNIPL